MKKINFCIGLPRSGSTLLMNILQQNPSIFTSSTCPTSYLLSACNKQATEVSEFIAMKQSVMSDCLTGFFTQGMQGWYNALTDKPVVFSKSRVWDTSLDFIFHAYEDPKIIVPIRDLRDIVCSFEKLLKKYPLWTIGSEEQPFRLHTFDKRIELYCTDVSANLGRPLYRLPHVYEWMVRRPNNFYLFRFEDFNQAPKTTLKNIYNWLGMPEYNHDLINIPQAEQYEHDTVYRALVSHETAPQLKQLAPSWPDMMTPEQSATVIVNNEWFYKTFYPEIYNDYISNRS